MKKVKENELNNVNGGLGARNDGIVCTRCGTIFQIEEEKRYVGSGCDGHYEYKCPVCHEWNL